MNIQRAAPVNELLAKLIFLILPTCLVSYYLLHQANEYYTLLQNDAANQAMYFSIGMVASAVFYAFRFRFLPTFAALLFTLYMLSKGIDALATGEFDGPFIHVRFIIISTLFSAGWVVGWGFLRLRYWSIGIASGLLALSILIVAKSKSDTVDNLLWSFSPVVLYAIYIVFTAEQIYSYQDKSQKFWWFLTRRIALFSGLLVLLLFGVTWIMGGEIADTVANYGGGGKAGKNSMLKANKDGTFDLKDYSQLRSQLGRSNELLFCAHIDNYFEGTEQPNPLYLTAFYYTKFDTSTETFERDSIIPKNDLFEPDPSRLSLFSTKVDTTVINNSGTDEYGKIVEIQVYSRKLSPHTYLAPHTGFFVQPITVERNFRDSFKTAFRAKSFVSSLNSAYAVYNAQNKEIKAFQEGRFKIMRKYTDYGKTDAAFMKYYTYMPGDAKFKNIAELAQQVAGAAKTPVDKTIAIRDWFLSKDAAGQPLFKYTDNPGVPDIPNASKLQYFLFENRKGYCAYYAGATLFMLRSLGIPSRIAVGFMTVDRSDKNKGWYWYYADQAHAWVQVYFPGLGWLDFDTTVGNSDAQESPKPDGTPPMQPPRAWLAADGTILSTDTAKKIIHMKVKQFVFHDKEYKLLPSADADMDVHIAQIRRDSVEVPLSSIQNGEAVTVVSYADAFKNMAARNAENGQSLLKRFPNPAPIDEVYVKRTDSLKKEIAPKPEAKVPASSFRSMLIKGISIAVVIVVFFFLWPSILLALYKFRAKTAKASGKKSYWVYRTSMFYLHQLDFNRGKQTPMQYAREVVDPALGTQLSGFMNIYLKEKYAQQELNKREQETVTTFLSTFFGSIHRKLKWNHRAAHFLNPMRAISFFVSTDEDAKEA